MNSQDNTLTRTRVLRKEREHMCVNEVYRIHHRLRVVVLLVAVGHLRRVRQHTTMKGWAGEIVVGIR